MAATTLGIELGSTRIKAVLTAADHTVLATGSHTWENRYAGGVWTYALDDVWSGLRDCVGRIAAAADLGTVTALGVSAMMHGYLAFDADGELLTPFRTWRNTGTGVAAGRLSEEFGHNIPHRWSIAHLYQAVLDGEEHVGRLDHLTTLAGYVHQALTGRRVLGVGDASGMFPIDPATGTYDERMMNRFAGLVPDLDLHRLLPEVLTAGEPAGQLSAAGAARLDPSGALRPGIVLCPPEGDAGTGMVATNSVAPRTGTISAGTSIFAMVVLERPLPAVHREIDLVTTPDGQPVAMVHCNNGASELDAWAGLFADFAAARGLDLDRSAVFETLLRAAATGAPDAGGLTAFNYLSGEPITGLAEGRPLFLRSPDSTFTLATFIRAQLYAALATLRIGLDVLRDAGAAELDTMFAHGGLFRTEGVAQRILAAAIGTGVSVGDLAGEGGAWGIAILAGYVGRDDPAQTLSDYLRTRVFAGARLDTAQPDPAEAAGFDAFLKRFVGALPVQRAAVAHS